jgi:hypothetical protein
MDAGHNYRATYFDLMTVHSKDVPAITKPWPLQAFCPLQAEAAVLQALWPLQALAPEQATWAWAAAAKVLTAKMVAAVAAKVRLVMTMISLNAKQRAHAVAAPVYARGGGTDQRWRSRFGENKGGAAIARGARRAA